MVINISKVVCSLLVLNIIFSPGISAEDGLLKNGSFEKLKKNGAPEDWIISSKKSRHHNIDSNEAYDGKNSFYLKETQGTYDSISQKIGSGLIKNFKGKYKLSAWIKTEGMATGMSAESKVHSRPFFGIYTYTEKRRNSATMPIGTIDIKKSGWHKYEKTFSQTDMENICLNKTREEMPYSWEIRANLNNQPGCMWIDKVEFNEVDIPAVVFKLNSKEYSMDTGIAILDVKINSEKIPAGNQLKIIIYDQSGIEVVAKDVSAKDGEQIVNLDISKLSIGDYKVVLETKEPENRFEQNFKKIQGAFDF